ncbi:MAG: PEP-CTERM sorting domain-containing protein [Sedimentisphaerales bacterium]|nr:PEP-CTERM sorting domain-containing protein [Sedimentisphaerales bacterium]
MKPGRICSRSLTLAIVLATAVAGRALPIRADTTAYDLVIQPSPLAAGDVTPEAGAHRVSANSSVTLTASAQRGYRFAYWLGDVSDPDAERTTILINEPKIVIAVFHPQPLQRVQEHLPRGGGGGGLDMTATTSTDFYAPAFTPPSGSAKTDPHPTHTAAPAAVPEPATLLLLCLGTLALRRGR